MKKLVTLLLMVVALNACSSQETEKLTCKAVGDNDAIVFNTTYYYTVGEEESKLVKMESETEVTLNDSDLTKESQEALAKSIKEEYSNYSAIDYSYTVNDETLHEKVKVDLTKLSTDELKSLQISIDTDSGFVLEEFKSNLEVLGYTCE